MRSARVRLGAVVRDLSRRAVLGAGAAALALPALSLAAEKKKGGGETYIAFAPLEAAIAHGRRRNGVLSVEGGLDVPDAALRARATAAQPILRDAYLSWLGTYSAALPPDAPPDADEIAAQLQRITDRVLGRPGARFLIGTVMAN